MDFVSTYLNLTTQLWELHEVSMCDTSDYSVHQMVHMLQAHIAVCLVPKHYFYHHLQCKAIIYVLQTVYLYNGHAFTEAAQFVLNRNNKTTRIVLVIQ